MRDDRVGSSQPVFGDRRFDIVVGAPLSSPKSLAFTDLIHGAIKVVPWPAHPDGCLIHAPADVHQPLAAVERILKLRALLHHPTADGGMIDRHIPLLHQLFNNARP
jgi:hypothetical protein